VKQMEIKQVKAGRVTKVRQVYNPSPGYKKLLRAINKTLQRRVIPPRGVLGGFLGKCIDDMAKAHCDHEAVFSLDLKDFFPSITSGRVVKMFRRAGCSPEISGLLADLVTLDGALPQGFPTSPIIANLVAYGLDMQHLDQCDKSNITRTRWIDDIIFSGRAVVLRENIRLLMGAIAPHGFKLNYKKTAYKVRANHPVVTGLDARGKTPHVPIAVIERVRKILIECQCSGVAAVAAAYECDAFGNKKNVQSSMLGKIRHIEKYNKEIGLELMDLYNSVDWIVRK
jgi:RNA-directed DNA polymerase